jgi:hypothetical protein
VREQNINCPKCGEPIDVSEVLSRQVETRLKTEFEARQAEHDKELECTIRDRVKQESEAEMSELKKELDEKSDQLRDLNKTKAEIERLRREKEGLRDEIVLEKEIEFSEKLKSEKSRIRGSVEEEVYVQAARA